MRLLIAGLPRTGTTALYALLMQALGPDVCGLFEPPHAVPLVDAGDRHVLVKLLVTPLPGTGWPHVEPRTFAHTLCLVRDPRDRVISSILFLLHWGSETYPALSQDPATFAPLLALLRQKEASPSRVPFWSLFEAVMQARFGFTGAEALAWVQQQEESYGAFAASLAPPVRVRYDALVAGRLGGLSRILHVALPPRAPVAPAHRAIFRTGGAGAWRHWFTPDDQAYFAPLLLAHTRHEGPLPGAERLAAVQVIPPRTSSQYVRTWCRVWARQARYASA